MFLSYSERVQRPLLMGWARPPPVCPFHCLSPVIGNKAILTALPYPTAAVISLTSRPRALCSPECPICLLGLGPKLRRMEVAFRPPIDLRTWVTKSGASPCASSIAPNLLPQTQKALHNRRQGKRYRAAIKAPQRTHTNN